MTQLNPDHHQHRVEAPCGTFDHRTILARAVYYVDSDGHLTDEGIAAIQAGTLEEPFRSQLRSHLVGDDDCDTCFQALAEAQVRQASAEEELVA